MRRSSWPLAVIVAAVALIALAGLNAAGCGESEESSAPPRSRNVVVVMTDDQEAESVRFLPHVARMARRGTTFREFFATTPLCCPSRASFLTGKYSHNHEVLGNRLPDGGFQAFDGSDTLAVWMRQAGYRTAHIGRYLNNYGAPNHPGDPKEVPPGWDVWEVPVLDTEFQMFNYTLNENGDLRDYGSRPRDYQTDVLARKAVGFVEEEAGRGRPFFLSVATLAPHDEGVLEGVDAARNPRPAPRHRGTFSDQPLPRPASFDEAAIEDKPPRVRNVPRLSPTAIEQMERAYRSRLESLLAVDEMVADLVGALRRAGELEDTLFLFTSDNGYLLGQHRVRGKASQYEEAIRAPLVIAGPGFPAGAKRHQPSANVDLAPTILEVTGVRASEELDGASLVPVANDSATGSKRTLLLEMLTKHKFVGVHTDRFVYVQHENGPVELYDLHRDPHQLRNVADDRRYSRVRARLAERLEALRDCAGVACRPGAG